MIRMKIPTAPIDESMILSSLTRSVLMDTTCLSSIYLNEIEGVSSGAWLIKLMDEIDEPDQPHPSVFDDSDEEDIDRQSSEKSRLYSLGQVGSSVSTAGATADIQRVHLSSMAPAIKVVELDLSVREEDIRDDDVLKGRGGRSIRHVGNKRFRKIIEDMKEMYQKMSDKTDKTALSRAIVEYVHAKGGRFLIKETNGQVGWTVMTKAESRKKTSQALRETKT